MQPIHTSLNISAAPTPTGKKVVQFLTVPPDRQYASSLSESIVATTQSTSSTSNALVKIVGYSLAALLIAGGIALIILVGGPAIIGSVALFMIGSMIFILTATRNSSEDFCTKIARDRNRSLDSNESRDSLISETLNQHYIQLQDKIKE